MGLCPVHTFLLGVLKRRSEELKTVNETFSDEEFEELKKAKDESGMSWHDFILTLAERKEV